MSQISGQNMLITGGASGIGRLMALKLAAKGGHIVIWDIDATRMNSVVDEIKTGGHQAQGYLCDLSSKSSIAQAAAQVKREVGPIHILINNAGIVSGQPFLKCSDEQIERTMAINTMAHFWTVRAFLPEMVRDNKGHIVTIASAGGLVGVHRLADYSASKHAAVGFDESLRMEFRRTGSQVRTTVVCPFFINTGMFEGVKTRFPWLLPIMEPEDVVNRIVRAIEKDKARLVMPWFVYTTWLIRVLPIPMFDALASFFGINNAMDEFVGRK